MILRSLAALVFTTGSVVLIVALSLIGGAPGVPAKASHMRAMKNRREAPPSATALSYDGLRALPHRAALAAYAPLEARGVVMEGYVQRMLHAQDGDIHLELAQRALGPGDRDREYATAEITPAWREGSRTWRYEPLLAEFRPNRGGASAWDGGPARVRITGWLLYDYQYDRPPAGDSIRGVPPRLTGWEVHPVTKIEAWSAADSAWREVAR